MISDEGNNNNNDKNNTLQKAADTAKEVAKEAAKVAVKKAIQSGLSLIGPYVLPVIGIIFLVIVGVYILSDAFSVVGDKLKELLGLDSSYTLETGESGENAYNGENSSEDGTSQTIEEVKKAIHIENNGYKLNDEYTEKILEKLEEVAYNPALEAFGFINENNEDTKDMLYKYLKAEIKLMTPKLKDGEDDDEAKIIDGIIEIYREDGTRLQYMEYNQFKALIDANDIEALKYFSLTEDFEIVLAIETDIYVNDVLVEVNVSMSSPIDYMILVEDYAVPFNYFVALHLGIRNSDNKFMNDFYDLAVKPPIKIHLTFIETPTIHYIHTQTTVISKDGHGSSTTEDTLTKIVIRDGQLCVTEADTCFLDLIEFNCNKTTTESARSTSSTTSQGRDEYGNNATIVTTTTTWTEETQLTTVSVNKYNVWSFLNLLNKVEDFDYSSVLLGQSQLKYVYGSEKDTMINELSLILYMLQLNENTQKLMDVMKYIGYLLTGNDYGITNSAQLEFLSENDFVSVNNGQGSNSNGGSGGSSSEGSFAPEGYDGLTITSTSGNRQTWGTYTASNGKTYTLYMQNYKASTGSGHWGTNSESLCLAAAYAIANSGYGSTKTPDQYWSTDKAIGAYQTITKDQIVNCLKSGQPVIVFGDYNDQYWDKGSDTHALVLLDVRETSNGKYEAFMVNSYHADSSANQYKDYSWVSLDNTTIFSSGNSNAQGTPKYRAIVN